MGFFFGGLEDMDKSKIYLSCFFAWIDIWMQKNVLLQFNKRQKKNDP